MIGADGSGFHDIGGALEGRSASGTPTAGRRMGRGSTSMRRSSSGNGRLFRANVDGRFSEPLTDSSLSAFAPALSPDGSQVSFIVERSGTFDLYAARGDGADPHLVLSNATNEGWSTDSEFILASWAPRPAVASRPFARTARTAGSSCRSPSTCPLSDCPGKGLSWGQPRP